MQGGHAALHCIYVSISSTCTVLCDAAHSPRLGDVEPQVKVRWRVPFQMLAYLSPERLCDHYQGSGALFRSAAS